MLDTQIISDANSLAVTPTSSLDKSAGYRFHWVTLGLGDGSVHLGEISLTERPEPVGSGGGGSNPPDPSLPSYSVSISSDTNNVDVTALLTSLTGWTTGEVANVTVTVDTGVVVGSNSVSGFALDFDALPSGSTATLINNGDIIGRYGSSSGVGGNAVRTSVPLDITNNGQIYAGGGGGSTGSSASLSGFSGSNQDNCQAGATCTAPGGAGGIGAGWYSAGSFYSSGGGGSGGGSCTLRTNNNCNQNMSVTGGSGSSGGGLGQSGPGGLAGIVFDGMDLITLTVAGTWGGRTVTAGGS